MNTPQEHMLLVLIRSASMSTQNKHFLWKNKINYLSDTLSYQNYVLVYFRFVF